MGMNANTQIWLGFREDSQGEPFNVISRLPAWFCKGLEKRGWVEFSGFEFRMFKHADDLIGFGIELLDRGWRDGPVTLDLMALAKKVQEVIPSVENNLKLLGITDKPCVWLATNL